MMVDSSATNGRPAARAAITGALNVSQEWEGVTTMFGVLLPLQCAAVRHQRQRSFLLLAGALLLAACLQVPAGFLRHRLVLWTCNRFSAHLGAAWFERILRMPWNWPNTLTWLRIYAIPLIALLFYMPYPWADPSAALLFAAAGITDSLDGYLARRLGQTSRLGAFLDPVADKLIVAVALVLLVSKDARALIVLTAIVIIGREITISALREWMAEIGARRKVAVSQLGKYKTILQITGLSMMLYRWPLVGMPTYRIGVALTVVAAAATLVSMLAYLRAAWPELRR